MDIVRMGELRVCGKPIVLGEQYTGGPITIEDTPPIGGMEFFELNKSFFVIWKAPVLISASLSKLAAGIISAGCPM